MVLIPEIVGIIMIMMMMISSMIMMVMMLMMMMNLIFVEKASKDSQFQVPVVSVGDLTLFWQPFKK